MRRRAVPLRRALPALLLWGLWCGAGCEMLVDGNVHAYHCSEEDVIGQGACPAHHICKSHSCVPLSMIESKSGAPCEDDAGCPAGDVCLDPAALGGAGARRCSHPCCATPDCGSGTGLVCWSPPLGGVSFCRAASALELPAVGKGAAGTACAAGSDCRSGRCDKDGICVDGCCSDAHCANGDGACRFGERAGTQGFFCEANAKDKEGEAQFGVACEKDNDCASGICLKFGDTGMRCSKPCCSSTDCGSYADDNDRNRGSSCAQVEHAGVLVRACLGPTSTGKTSDIGAACVSDKSCRSNICATSASESGSSFCSDTCCNNEGCANTDSFACRLHPSEVVEGGWALRCERK